MLGSIGPLVKDRLLTSRGYELYRPTGFERTILRSPFEDWYSKDIAAFAEVYRDNREVLAGIPRWVRPEDLIGSLWRYGVPEQWDTGKLELGKTGLNEVELEPTYSDLIAFICRKMPDLRYFEIGVSVGKNFLQVVRNTKGKFTGLDVEKINPVLSEALGGGFAEHRAGITQTVETLSGQMGYVDLATYTSGDVAYLRGDQFGDDTWSVLDGQRFNFIFSDGVHSPRALRTEMDFLLRHNLIDTSGPFVMYWDDLVNIEMQTAFNDCAMMLRDVCGGGWHGLHWINGTYGAKRLNGLFASKIG